MGNSNKGVIFCPRCGTKNLVGAKFCIHCGYSLAGIKVDNSMANSPASEVVTTDKQQTESSTSSVVATSTRKRRQGNKQRKRVIFTLMGVVIVMLGIIGGKTFLDHRKAANAAWYATYNPKTGKVYDPKDAEYGAMRISGDMKTATFTDSLYVPATILLMDYKLTKTSDSSATYEGTLTNSLVMKYKFSKVKSTQLLNEGRVPKIYGTISSEELLSDKSAGSPSKNGLEKVKITIGQNKILHIKFIGAKNGDTYSFKKREGKDPGSAKIQLEKVQKQKVKKVPYKSSLWARDL